MDFASAGRVVPALAGLMSARPATLLGSRRTALLADLLPARHSHRNPLL